MVSVEHLFEAWWKFRRGKRARMDIQIFERHLERNIFELHDELSSDRWRHGAYESFYVHDPKIRHIRKAAVRDRLVHQVVFDTLEKLFEPRFIFHQYASRIGKGTHRAVDALYRATRSVSRNYTRPCYALKCDVRRFFDSIDHSVLLDLIGRPLKDKKAFDLMRKVIASFDIENHFGKGIPIGNLTSQIFMNIYLNELDQFVKHDLRIEHYLRYSDDFLLLSTSRSELEACLDRIGCFLHERLLLELHPNKVSIRPLQQGIDFVGYVTLPHYRVIRTRTRKRMILRLGRSLAALERGESLQESLLQARNSYLGVLSHADAFEIRQQVLNLCSSRLPA